MRVRDVNDFLVYGLPLDLYALVGGAAAGTATATGSKLAYAAAGISLALAVYSVFMNNSGVVNADIEDRTTISRGRFFRRRYLID